MLINELVTKGLAAPPKWLPSNTLYLTVMGSMAYGCNENESDLDVYGFAIAPKSDTFPHLAGEIHGFGRQKKRFDQYLQHHIFDQSARAGRGQEYDVTIFNIVKFFSLCMDNNPNMLEPLFTARECVLHSTGVAELVRDRRRIFLHKGSWHRFKGFAYSQLSKMNNQAKKVAAIRKFEDEHSLEHSTAFIQVQAEMARREIGGCYDDRLNNEELREYERLWRDGLYDKDDEQGSKRFPMRKRFGYDVKFAMHLVRLVGECEQILTTGDIDLRRDSAMLRDIRAGNWTEQQVRDWFSRREKEIEPLYTTSTAVPYEPDEDAIRRLLLECLDHHYGNISDAVVETGIHEKALRDIRTILDGVKV